MLGLNVLLNDVILQFDVQHDFYLYFALLFISNRTDSFLEKVAFEAWGVFDKRMRISIAAGVG